MKHKYLTLVPLLSLSLMAAGCMSHTRFRPDEMKIEGKGTYHISTADGQSFVLKNTEVANDTLTGTQNNSVVTLPIASISSVVQRKTNWTRTAVAAGAILYLGLSAGITFERLGYFD
jgi:hypothetical protein